MGYDEHGPAYPEPDDAWDGRGRPPTQVTIIKPNDSVPVILSASEYKPCTVWDTMLGAAIAALILAGLFWVLA